MPYFGICIVNVSHLRQSGNGIPASGSVWSWISPTLSSYGPYILKICRCSKTSYYFWCMYIVHLSEKLLSLQYSKVVGPQISSANCKSANLWSCNISWISGPSANAAMSDLRTKSFFIHGFSIWRSSFFFRTQNFRITVIFFLISIGKNALLEICIK